jgi:hypothetical protein
MAITMPTLFMLCGLPASGKTTPARRLQGAGARCFILDEMVVASAGDDTTDDDLSERVAEAA